MYAIIQVGKHQYRAETGQSLSVEKIDGEVGSKVTFNNVLAVGSGENLRIGKELKASVSATIKAQEKDKKIVVYKKKRRKGYERTQGHRQLRTILEITDIAG